jgi:D-alanyl-lipoteichoic acid acyltransferase DltB (MBOAT superfamily)
MRAERNFFRFLLFVAFFPHLMAGPIIRAPDFIRQLYRPRRISWQAATEGAWLVLQGYFLKMVCANNLAMVVDRYWTDDYIAKGSAGSLLLLALLFSGQIFCDFAGYSAIARGLAYWLGFKFPVNFNCPYIASSFRDFWQRWHITLSTWLRDYLYIPLGGNRTGSTYRNLLITMVVAGLWHGAGFTFIAWGLLHGLALVGERMLGLDSAACARPLSWLRVPWAAVVQIGVLAAWVIFRSSSLPQALHFIGRTVAGRSGEATAEIARGCWYLLPPLLLHLHALLTEAEWLPAVGYRAKAALAAAMLLLILTAYGPNHTFIYFQF